MFVMMSYSFSLCDNNKFKFINKFRPQRAYACIVCSGYMHKIIIS